MSANLSFFDAPAPGGVATPSAPSFFDTTSPSTGPVGPPVQNYSPLGFLHNLGTGFIKIASGITGLVKMGVQDIYHLGADFYPGHQAIEDQPYNGELLAQTLPGALKHDYAQRYGGLSNITKGFYADPLSYIGDALMIAGGVSAVAKAGRVGGLLGGLPELLPEATAVKVLGGTVEKGLWVKGTAKFGSLSLTGGATELLPLSGNPLTRLAQKGFYNLASWSAEGDRAARFLSNFGEDSIAFMRADEAIGAAAENGMRVLSPKLGAIASNHWVSSSLSWMRMNAKDLSKAAVDSIKAPFEQFKGLPQEEQIAIREAAFEYSMGTASPLDRPDTNFIPIAPKLVPELEQAPMVGLFEAHTDTPELLYKQFGTGVRSGAIVTPHGGDLTGSLDSWTVIVDNMNDAETTGIKALQGIGAEPIGVKNYLSKETPYDGFFMYGQRQDGSIAQINVATDSLYLSQQNASHVIEQVTKVQLQAQDAELALAEAIDATKTGTKTGQADIAKAQSAYNEAAIEQQAADAFLKDQIFVEHKRDWWSENPTAATPRWEGDTRTYDPVLKAADRSDALRYQEVTKRWIDNNNGSYSTWFERAYAPQRELAFQAMKDQMLPMFKNILEGTKDSSSAAAKIMAAMRDMDIPDSVVSEIVGSLKITGDRTGSLTRLMDKVDGTLGEYIIQEGGRSAEFGYFPGYDWRVMHEARLSAELPTASYIPHMTARPSEVMGLSKAPRNITTPGVAKPYKGILFHRNTLLRDPVAASSRAAEMIVRSQEANSFIDRMLESSIPRQLTAGELQAIHENPALLGGERLWAPGLIKSQVKARGNFLSDVAGEIGDVGTDRALSSAVSRFTDTGAVDNLNELAASGVYAVPKSAAGVMEREVKLMLGDGVKMFYDTPMNLWKSSVLSLSPRWVVNNVGGNSIFLGIENPGALRFMLSQLKTKNEHLLRLLAPAEALRTTEAGFFHGVIDHSSALATEVGQKGFIGKALQKMAESVVGRTVTKISDWVRGMNSAFEEAARRGVFVDAARKEVLKGWGAGFHADYKVMEEVIARGGMSEAQTSRVIVSADKALGNYIRYSPVEQQIVRRFLIPFYGFYRHSLGVILRLPFEHPLKGRVLESLGQLEIGMDQTLPDYYRSYVPLGVMGGNQFALNIHSLNPLSQITEGIPILGAFNPIAKIFIERQLGVNSFTGQPFTSPGDVVGPYGGKYWQIQKDSAGNFVGVIPTSTPLPDPIRHVLSQIPQLALLAPFKLYPKSSWLQLANMAGLPIASKDFDQARQYYAQDTQRAVTTAQNIVSPPVAGAENSFFA